MGAKPEYISLGDILNNHIDSLVNGWDTWFNDSDYRLKHIESYPHDIYIDKKTQSLIFDIAATGISKDNIEIKVINDIIEISINHEKKEDDVISIVKKISKRSVVLKYRISDKYLLDNIDIKFDNGLLHITIPIKEQTRSQEKILKF